MTGNELLMKAQCTVSINVCQSLFDAEGKVIGLEIIGATERYSREGLFKLSTENMMMTEAA